MTNIMRFVILGDDRGGPAFTSFARQVERANKSVDRHNAALKRQSATAAKATAVLGRAGAGGGILAIGSAALAAAGPLGALTLAAGAFAAVAAPAFTKPGKPVKDLQAAFAGVQKTMLPLVNQVISLGAGLLKDLLPALKPLATAGASVITSFLRPLDAFARSKAFAQIVSQLAAFAVQAGQLAGPAVTRLAGQLLTLFVKVMPAGIKILGALLPAISTIVTDLTPVIAAVANVTAGVLQWLSKTHLLIPALAATGVAITLAGGPISAIAAGVALVVVGVVELVRHWRAVWGEVTRIAQAAWSFLTHGWGQFLFPGLFLIRETVGFVRDHWRDAWNAITAVGRVFLGWFRNSLVAKIASGIGGIVGWFTGLPGRVMAAVSSLTGSLLRFGKNAISSLWNGFKAIWNGAGGVIGWVGAIPGKIVSAAGKAGTVLWSWGKGVIQGLLSGFGAIWQSVVSFFTGLPKKILGWLGINSPPKWAIQAGKDIARGLGIGLDFAHGVVSKATARAVQAAAVGALGGPTSASAAQAQAYARSRLAAFGWGPAQMNPLIALWNQESGWNRLARNPSSGAYGIPQALPPSKMGAAANPPTSSAAAQINWGLSYIKGRYGSPAGAWGHETAFNWYGRGGPFRAGQLIGVGDRGPELVSFTRPGRVYSPEQSAALAGGNTYHITVNVPPTASKADTGRAVVECIREYERGSGARWRK